MAYPKSRVAVYTSRYTSEYGTSPRGYGDWYFKCRSMKTHEKFEINFLAMYSEAKKKAIEFASEHDCVAVTLLT